MRRAPSQVTMARRKIRELTRELHYWRDGDMLHFLNLGVQVGESAEAVVTEAQNGLKAHPRTLGRLKGAQAMVTDGTSAHRIGAGAVGALVAPPLALLALTKKQRATAVVVFPDGTVHRHNLRSSRQVRQAQAEAIRFNAMAAAAERGSST